MGIVSFNRAKGFPKSRRQLERRGQLPQIKTYHTDRFDIEVDSDDDFGNVILDALPIQVGDDWGGGELVTKVAIDRDATVRRKWYADLEYEPVGEEDRNAANVPPDELTPIWGWSSETIERLWITDSDGKPLCNSAGEAIDLPRPIAVPILTIERYKPTFDQQEIIDYVNHRNDAGFWDADEGAAVISAITDQKDTHVIYAGRYYRKVSYTIKFALPFIEEVLEGWKDILVDQGTYYFDANRNRVHFTAGGSEVTGNLDGYGSKLPDDQNVHLLEFWRNPKASFGALDLGPYE